MKDGQNTAHWIIAVGLTLAVIMDAFNGTVFTISRPQIMGSLRVTADEASWANLAYLIAKAAGLPTAAWIVDRFGERRSLFWSVTIIVAGSLLCTLAIGMPLFVGARIFHGAAGAVLLVAAQTILLRLFPPASQALVQALYAVGVMMAPTTFAPAVQGWLTDSFSWNWVFWLNAGLTPVVLLCLLPYRKRLPNTVQLRRPFDGFGFCLFLLAMAALIYVLLEGSRWNWFDDDRITLFSGIGIGAGIVFVVWRVIDARARLIERTIFSNTQFTFGFTVSFVAGFVLSGSAFLIPAFALGVLALPAMDTGLLLLPSSAAVGAGLLIAGALITWKKINPLLFTPLGIVLVMTAMWMLSGSSSESGAQDLWPSLLVRGLGLGFLFISITVFTLTRLDADHIASGVGLFNFGRQMGGVIGISFLSTYLDHQTALNRRVLIKNIDLTNLSFQQYQETLSTALTVRGLNPELAMQGALAVIQKHIMIQAAVLSFNEAFFSLVLLFLVAAPLVMAFKGVQKLFGRRR